MQKTPGILDPQVQNFIREFGLREPQALRELRTATVNSFRGFLLTPEAGQFLQLLLKLTNAKRVLDIGCFTGYSSLASALAMGKDGRVITFDVSEEFTKTAREHWAKNGVSHQIELQMGSAVESLQALIAKGEKEKFDASFIDADKANYENYIELSYQLVRPGGFLLLDNVLWQGTTADPQTGDKTGALFAKITKKLQSDERFDFEVLSIGDGLMLLRKR